MRASFLAAVVAMAVGCGGSSPNGYSSPPPACTAATATQLTTGTPVTMPGFFFSPSCAKVAAGTTLTFTNNDPMAMAHTVTADAGGFDHVLTPGQQATQAFPTAGTVGIHCTYHVATYGMRMTLIVQ